MDSSAGKAFIRKGMIELKPTLVKLYWLPSSQFGFDRYGKPINPESYQRGIEEYVHAAGSRRHFLTGHADWLIRQQQIGINAKRVFDSRHIIKNSQI